MPNPVHLLAFWGRRRRPRLMPVRVPTTVGTTDVIFLLMRRMRAPLIVLITNFSFCTGGLMLMPGIDAAGNPYRLTVFDAFYQMTITVTTVGYSEVPHAFSYPQRMWLSMSIYLVVISWAYAIGVFFSLVNDAAFQDAIAAQRFRRQVRRLVEPFVIVAGYGQAGRAIGAELDGLGHRFVVVDNRESRVESVLAAQLSFDVPAVEGDAAVPAVLGMAGLGHRDCEGVLALTEDDTANLAVVMTVALLRPGLPVFARCGDVRIQARIEHFAPGAAINPDDRFGDYLALSIHRPVNHQLLRWLMDNDEEELPPVRTGGLRPVGGLRRGALRRRRAARSGSQRAHRRRRRSVRRRPRCRRRRRVHRRDRRRHRQHRAGRAGAAGQPRRLRGGPPAGVHQEVTAGGAADRLGLHRHRHGGPRGARPDPHPGVFAVRRPRVRPRRAVGGRGPRSPAGALRQPHPQRDVVTISPAHAPAIVAWLSAGRPLTIGDLLRRPDDRDTMLPLGALVLLRDGEPMFLPGEDTALTLADQVLLVGKPDGLTQVRQVCDYPATLEYVATGREVPTTWLWSWLTDRWHRRD